MNQLFLILISLVYGFVLAFIDCLIFKKNNVFKIIYFLVGTFIYIYIFYLLNSGEIHLYNKISLVLGYTIFYTLKKCKTKCKIN